MTRIWNDVKHWCRVWWRMTRENLTRILANACEGILPSRLSESRVASVDSKREPRVHKQQQNPLQVCNEEAAWLQGMAVRALGVSKVVLGSRGVVRSLCPALWHSTSHLSELLTCDRDSQPVPKNCQAGAQRLKTVALSVNNHSLPDSAP